MKRQDSLDDGGDAGVQHNSDYEMGKSGDDLETYIEDIAETVRIGLDQSIAILTPWFFNNMPRAYYQTTPRPEKVRHLSAIITGHVFETKQTVELWDRDKSRVTYIGPGSDRKILVDMAHKLVSYQLKMGSLYFSRDRLLFLSTFLTRNFRPLDQENTRIVEKVGAARKLIQAEFPDDGEFIESYLRTLDNDFVMYATAGRISVTYRMVRYMRDHESAHTILEPIENSASARLMLGMKNINPSEILEQILHLINRYEFNVVRAFVVSFIEGYPEPVTVMLFIINQHDAHVSNASVPYQKLAKALKTLGWVDTDEYSVLVREPQLYSVNAANLIRAAAAWIHVLLGKKNPHYFSVYKIRSTIFRHEELARRMVELFRAKFDPGLSTERANGVCQNMRAAVSEEIDRLADDIEKGIFSEWLSFTDNVLKTNYFAKTKTGLAFRMSPEVLDKTYYPERPFGIFFVIGKDYRFFHVRWKDIARGGLRVVVPRSPSDYDYALSGLFDEVYGLSLAQQLKNKDIPEGGSKGVLLLRPGGSRDQAVHGAVNAMLDLLVSNDESNETSAMQFVSYYDREELIYLGPDENITPDLIEWITAQAARRGYRYANAFMSSKIDSGINHKEYGVTSEGLHVFLDNTLRFLGIDPKHETFSITMTGGPDGDVAGNELKILHRECGERARVLAIADGFGAAHDPKGLNWPELLRLVRTGQSIAEFAPSALSGDAKAFVVRANSNETIRIRNELHFNVTADVFIPAGGRPYSVNDRNWDAFLDPARKPRVRAIVEGANIFFTKQAREHLQECGILILKDSSANKAGVICSSYEVIASLILTPAEFRKIKEDYVADVIRILRAKADAEAQLLFREYIAKGGERYLVQLSMDISKEINETKDALLEEFHNRAGTILENPLFRDIVRRHTPPSLLKAYGADIVLKLPETHRVAIVAAYLASYIVYREGLGWLQRIPVAGRFRAAMTYLEQDRVSIELIAKVEKSNIDEKQKIIAILRNSATRDLTMIELGKDNEHGGGR